MNKYNLDFSHTSYFVIDKNSKKIGSLKIKEKLNYNNLIKSCDIGLSTVVAKKKVFIKNKFTSLKTKEDYLLWLKLLKKKKIYIWDKQIFIFMEILRGFFIFFFNAKII